MNNGIRRASLAGALLLAASPAFAQSARIVTQGAAYAYAEERAAVERTIDRALGMPPASGAQVVFFRPASARGQASISEGGATLASLAGDSYAAIRVAPGTHTFVVDGSPLRVRVDAGTRRFVRIVDRAAGPQLAASHAPTFLRTSLAKR
jgi:hypothetical protein